MSPVRGSGASSTPGAVPTTRFRSDEGARIALRTPAKINLGLRITGRRADGYHLLDSVFVPIELFDEVVVAVEPGPDAVDFELLEPLVHDLPPALRVVTAGSDNLVARAAQAFRAATGLSGRIRLTLRKGIPAGAGLGGGSSDAAAVLLGLAQLARAAGSGIPDLAALALSLGADVPFFLSPQPARVTGIGEEIAPIEGLPDLDLVIANPGISVATAEVYRVADQLPDSLTASGAGSTMRAISRLSGEKEHWGTALGDLLVNDLEPAAIRLCPPIGGLIGRMREGGAIGAGMSGSGATVFGVFESAEQARKAAEELAGSRGLSGTASEVQAGRIWARATRVRATRSS